MRAWEVNREATLALGRVTMALDAEDRDATVNVTDLGDGTATVSVSLHVACVGAEALALAARVLEATKGEAVRAS